MIKLNLNMVHGGAFKVLCLGAHSDDIEIGCGGTILRLKEEYPECTFYWAVFSAIGVRKTEAQRGAESFVGSKRLASAQFKDFRDGFMPFAGSDVKIAFEELKETVSPDLIFTHNRRDAHQDHRLISELTWNTFRNHLILEYEVPKYEGDLGRPNLYVPLSSATAARKVELLTRHFPSQASRAWFRPDTFHGVMSIRGIECNAADGRAEAFHVCKATLG